MNFLNVFIVLFSLVAISSGVIASQDSLPRQIICVAQDDEPMKDSAFLLDVTYETVSQFSKSDYVKLGEENTIPEDTLPLNVDRFEVLRCPNCYKVNANLFNQAFYTFNLSENGATLNLSGEGMQGEKDIVIKLDCKIREE
jgi:hypothetical protein